MISEREFRLAVGYRLRLLRASQGESQSTFGERIGVGDTAVANYEKGERLIDPFLALILKQKLAVPLEWLFAGEETQLTPALKEKLAEAKRELAREQARKAAKHSVKKSA